MGVDIGGNGDALRVAERVKDAVHTQTSKHPSQRNNKTKRRQKESRVQTAETTPARSTCAQPHGSTCRCVQSRYGAGIPTVLAQSHKRATAKRPSQACVAGEVLCVRFCFDREEDVSQLWVRQVRKLHKQCRVATPNTSVYVWALHTTVFGVSVDVW